MPYGRPRDNGIEPVTDNHPRFDETPIPAYTPLRTGAVMPTVPVRVSTTEMTKRLDGGRYDRR